MKKSARLNPIRVALQRFTCALPLTAALWFGDAPAAHAMPPVTDGLVVWLSADTINPADTNQVRVVGPDTFVKQWNDGSGNVHHATNPVDAEQPKYIASGINGKPVLRFTQLTEDYGSVLKLGDLSAFFPSAGSIFAVSTINTDGRYNLFDNRTTNDSRWVANTWNESQPGVFANNRKSMPYASFPQTGSHVFAMESNSSIYRFVIDGTEIGSVDNTGNYNNGAGQSWTIGNRPGSDQQLEGDIPELLLYNRVLTSTESNLVGSYLTGKYGLAGISSVPNNYPAEVVPPAPIGVASIPVSSGTIKVSWPPLQGATSYLVSATNTITLAEQLIPAESTIATSQSVTITGLTNGTAYDFKVAGTNGAGIGAYSAIDNSTPKASSACNILTFAFPNLLDVIISGFDISLTVPLNTDITALAPVFTSSPASSSSFASGSSHDFSTPQSYTITADDGITFQTYTVTVTQGAVPNIFTWKAASTGNWSTSLQWANNLATGSKPISTGQADYTLNFTQAGTYSVINDLATGFILNQLILDGNVTLDPVFGSSQGLSLTANGAILPTIKQNSGNEATLNLTVNMPSNVMIDNVEDSQVTLAGLVTGAGSITKNGSGELKIYGINANTFNGGVIVNSGTLTLGADYNDYTYNSINPAGTGPITINNGATLQFDKVTLSNAVTLNGGTIFNPNGWETTISGPITLNGSSIIRTTTGALTCSGVMSGVGGFTKIDDNTLNLSGVNTYSGDTVLNAGTLTVNGNSIKDNNKLIIDGGKVAPTGTEVVGTLYFATVQQASGTWGATGSGATHIDDIHFSGTAGVVNVVSAVITDYSTWMANYPSITNPADQLVTADPDGDSLTNQQEYAFGLDPSSGSSANPISVLLNTTTGTFSYTRRATPVLTGLVYTVLTSTDLVTWTPDAGSAQSVLTNGAVETVSFTISKPAVNGKLFLRVQAVPVP
jgi:autotransporter-associated beta strand protein